MASLPIVPGWLLLSGSRESEESVAGSLPNRIARVADNRNCGVALSGPKLAMNYDVRESRRYITPMRLRRSVNRGSECADAKV